MFKSLEEKEIKTILSHNYIGHLAYIYKKEPYVIPITYYFDPEQHAIICYSGLGHKITAMRKTNAVSLQVADIDSVNRWKSVLVHGTFEELPISEARAQLHVFSLGVKDVILKREHRDLDFISEFSSKIYKDDVPIVFRIQIKSVTGKMRNHKS